MLLLNYKNKYKNKYLELNNKLIGGNDDEKIKILSFNGSELYNMDKTVKLSELLTKIILDKHSILFKLVIGTLIIDLTSKLNYSLENICEDNTKSITVVFVQDIKSFNFKDLDMYKSLFSDNINAFKSILDLYNIRPVDADMIIDNIRLEIINN